MMLQYFESLAQSIGSQIEADPDSVSANKIRAYEIARLGSKLYSNDGGVAWCGVYAPFDILNAMGITSCFVEFVGAMLALVDFAEPALKEAENIGYAAEACGYHRAILGSAAMGTMPNPDFLIATSCPCSGGLAVVEKLADIFKKDLFILQIPQKLSSGGVEYLTGQLKEMVTFVEAHTGKRMTDDNLREAMQKTNEARAVLEDVYQLAMHVPSPAAGKDLANFGLVLALFLGTDAAIDIAKAFRRDFQARIDAGQPGVAGEKKRLLWIQNRIQFRNPLIKLLESKGAAIVIDELNTIQWDPISLENPYEDIARRMITFPLNGPAEHRLLHMKELARTYRIDGAINPCNWGCRQGSGARGMMEESLSELGVPVMNLEVDCIDKRNFAEGQLKTRLEAFLEMLDSRPSPWT